MANTAGANGFARMSRLVFRQMMETGRLEVPELSNIARTHHGGW